MIIPTDYPQPTRILIPMAHGLRWSRHHWNLRTLVLWEALDLKAEVPPGSQVQTSIFEGWKTTSFHHWPISILRVYIDWGDGKTHFKGSNARTTGRHPDLTIFATAELSPMPRIYLLGNVEHLMAPFTLGLSPATENCDSLKIWSLILGVALAALTARRSHIRSNALSKYVL